MQLKLIRQVFNFALKIQQNFTNWNGVKTIEITPKFNGVARTFSSTGIWKFLQKRLFSWFRIVKTNFATCGPP